MKIGAINGLNYQARNVNFNGQWEMQWLKSYSSDPKLRKVYVPDKNESIYEVARAWEKETGKLPVDWVKENNPYNQSANRIQYEISGSPYIPLSLIRASAELKDKNLPYYDHVGKINKYIEQTKLAAQAGDIEDVAAKEARIKEEMQKIECAKDEYLAVVAVDNYKDGLGSDMMYNIRYGQD